MAGGVPWTPTYGRVVDFLGRAKSRVKFTDPYILHTSLLSSSVCISCCKDSGFFYVFQIPVLVKLCPVVVSSSCSVKSCGLFPESPFQEICMKPHTYVSISAPSNMIYACKCSSNCSSSSPDSSNVFGRPFGSSFQKNLFTSPTTTAARAAAAVIAIFLH